jgi:hypothetical protein
MPSLKCMQYRANRSQFYPRSRIERLHHSLRRPTFSDSGDKAISRHQTQIGKTAQIVALFIVGVNVHDAFRTGRGHGYATFSTILIFGYKLPKPVSTYIGYVPSRFVQTDTLSTDQLDSLTSPYNSATPECHHAR